MSFLNVREILAKPEGWHEARKAGIGASSAPKIMQGGDAALALWNEMTGRAEAEDLSRVLRVVMGSWTEPLNLYWFQQETGVSVRQNKERLFSAAYPFMHAELDGIASDGAPVEAKHVGAFVKEDDVVTRYYAQLQHQMIVTGAGHAYLSVFFGSDRWAYFTVDADPAYQAKLIQRETEFWRCVHEDVPPVMAEGSAPAVAFDDMRTVDMTGNNAFAAAAADWLANYKPAKVLEKTAKDLKAMVEPDVKLATGHGIQIARSKSGALTIKEAR